MAYSRSTKAMARPKNSRHNIPAQAQKKNQNFDETSRIKFKVEI